MTCEQFHDAMNRECANDTMALRAALVGHVNTCESCRDWVAAVLRGHRNDPMILEGFMDASRNPLDYDDPEIQEVLRGKQPKEE